MNPLDHDPKFLSGGTVAGNPARMNLNPVRWYLFEPLFPTMWLTLCIGGILLAVFVHWGFWIAAGAFALIFAFYWFQLVMIFRHGDTNPAIVVGTNPLLIAVHTDLSMGTGKYPVIKVFRSAARSARVGGWLVGQASAAVCHYAPPKDGNAPNWSDFCPIPAETGTGNSSRIEALIKSIDEEQWTELREGLRQIPQPYRPGLYPLGWNL